MTSQTIRIVNGGLEAESVAAIESAAASISRMYKVEVVDLKDAFVVDAGDSRRRPDIQLVAWVICIPRAFSACQVQSILARFKGEDSGLLVIAPDVGPLQAAFSHWPMRFLQFPADRQLLVEALQAAVQDCERADLIRIMRQSGRQAIIGHSPAFLDIVRRVRLAAFHDEPVIIQGETGTGKEVVARAIHYLSDRCAKPFITFQCATTPESLLENELFGHGPGAYTGAAETQQGVVESAEGGTLFLDEIDTLPLVSQAKVLRLIQEREYKPLGMPKSRTANIRILSASNRNLRSLVSSGEFREDLFYRLDLMTVNLPPLRERHEDIKLFAGHFLITYAAGCGKPLKGFSAEAELRLNAHSWPGNIRELEHAIHRAVLQAEGECIEAADLGLEAVPGASRNLPYRAARAKAEVRFEKEYIEHLLLANSGDVRRASQTAKLSERSFYRLMQKHRLGSGTYRTQEVVGLEADL